MASEIRSWQIVDGRLHEIDSSLPDSGRTEAYDLEEWIASEPSIIGRDLMIIGRQVQTLSGPLDLIGIDRDGNLVIVELKRGQLARDAVAQAIDYASDVANWGIDKIKEICTKYAGKDLEDLLAERYPEENLENLNINGTQRIVLVGFSIESALERMLTWLSTNFGVSVNAIALHYARTQRGEEVLSRAMVMLAPIVKTTNG